MMEPEIKAAMGRAYTAAHGYMWDRAMLARQSAAENTLQNGWGGRHTYEAEIAEEFAKEFADWAARKAPAEMRSGQDLPTQTKRLIATARESGLSDEAIADALRDAVEALKGEG